MNRRRLPRYVSEFVDRHGKVRVRFRRKGQTDHYFQTKPWSAEFMQEYQACLDRTAAPAHQPGQSRTKPGTINALIVAYYNSSEFKSLSPSTTPGYRSQIERFREKHGDKRVATMQRQHIKAILDAMQDKPASANNLLDRLRTLMRFAMENGMRKDDPTISIRPMKNTTKGFHAWTEEDIAEFENRHPLGTKARLALALLLYTCQRRSDVVRMGWQHVDGRYIKVRQQKTSAQLSLPMHPTLISVMAATPRENMTFLVTSHGKPFTSAGFGNWFRERCDEAALKHCSAHGLRKAGARRLAEAGCTNQQIKAITGHRTDSEVARYTAAANQEILAGQAMATAYGMDGEQKLSTQNKRLDNSAPNPLKTKD